MTEEAICDVCGEVKPLWDMKPLGIGRKTKYICYKCYNHGARDVENRKAARATLLKDKRKDR